MNGAQHAGHALATLLVLSACNTQSPWTAQFNIAEAADDAGMHKCDVGLEAFGAWLIYLERLAT
eukprot:6202071-Pleurochrysis_carterae.AAC.1